MTLRKKILALTAITMIGLTGCASLNQSSENTNYKNKGGKEIDSGFYIQKDRSQYYILPNK